MRSKATVNPQRASAANKPFMTEYRLAYRDPTASKKGKYGTAASKASKAPVKVPPPVKQPLAAPKPIVEEVIEVPSTSLTLPAMMSGAAYANLSLEAYRQRRRMLAAEKKKSLHQRYNVITGANIEGESSSGFKEGRRAVIQTCLHFDTITNARSPGYNILTGHDALSGKTADEIQKIYGNLTKPQAH